MDADRFDHFVRSLPFATRRSILGAALGGAALLGLGDATARKKRHRHKHKHQNKQPTCKGDTKPCGKQCIPSANCCSAADCDTGEACQDGHCTTSCEPRCDAKACGDDGCGGSCGNCGAGEQCQGGQCVCVPACSGKACGDDGCGGSCGSCLSADTCQQDQCVCSTPGAPGPGELCASADECCPYTELDERSCDFGEGGCQSFRPVCRYGFGGKCAENCDCLGNLECRDGSCRCPGGQNYLGGGVCCDPTNSCGNICCPPGSGCLCVPGFDCRCTFP